MIKLKEGLAEGGFSRRNNLISVLCGNEETEKKYNGNNRNFLNTYRNFPIPLEELYEVVGKAERVTKPDFMRLCKNRAGYEYEKRWIYDLIRGCRRGE